MEIGDKVQALDDDFEGVIISKKADEIQVEDIDGFVSIFHESELIPAVPITIKSKLAEVPEGVIEEKEEPKKYTSKKIPAKQRNAPVMEVDLHIHKLVERSGAMSNYEMLNLQLDTARRQLNFAISKRLQKMVFIHGVGEGVLREELYTLFRRYDNVKFYDADFQKYGLGATEVYIFQNIN
ncbi:Smr/MutS family protein [Dokdonia sp. Hel_I_53]|uniref:Smr/MutS family protein n=1 Tax=Dokdonia sp. Hel_I_53 TaxID=1566287 RepID=UPI00119B2B6A|nr:Smr/MutS family protein [Dokdonia sp. Hel_I_53]TVZ51827.1 Smr domain-containing protein [Dokdonia sp. Hel_I_53]